MTDEEEFKDHYRNPKGDTGRELLTGMNHHHMLLWDWCLEKMPKGMDGSVLDVGCGGGKFLHRMYERYPFAMFFGVDISDTALEFTSELDSDMVSEGSLELRNASVDDLPFEDGSIDLVTAIESYFFWPDLEKAVREVARVTSAGGVFVIGSEMQTDDPAVMKEGEEKYGAKVRSNEEILSIMDAAGFDAVVKVRPDNGNAVFVGVKRF